MTRVLRIALAVEEGAGVRALRLAAGSGHEVRLVLTTPPRDDGGPARGATPWHVAQGMACPILDAALVADPALAARIADLQVDLLLNVHSLHIAHAAVLAAPRIGSFNLHPGPLPQYAGLNAPSWAIWNAEAEHGVTVHWMEPGLDTGAVAYTTTFPLGEDDTGFTVSARCVREGIPLLKRLLHEAAADPARIPHVPQDLSRRRLYRRGRRPNDGRLSLEWSALRAVRLVRAASFHPLPSPWGVPVLEIGGREIGILTASVAAAVAAAPVSTAAPAAPVSTVSPAPPAPPGTVRRLDDGRIGIAFADGWLLPGFVVVGGEVHPSADVLL